MPIYENIDGHFGNFFPLARRPKITDFSNLGLKSSKPVQNEIIPDQL